MGIKFNTFKNILYTLIILLITNLANINDGIVIIGYGLYIYALVLFLLVSLTSYAIFRHKNREIDIKLLLIVSSIIIVYLISSRNINDILHNTIASLSLIVLSIIFPLSINSKEELFSFLKVITLFSLIVSFIGFYNNFNLIFRFLEIGFKVKDNIRPFTSNINTDAVYVVIGVFSSTLLYLFSREKKNLVYLLFCLIGVFMTFSRNIYLLAFIPLILTFVWFNKRIYKVLFMITGFIIIYYFFNNIESFFGQGEDILTGRTDLWNLFNSNIYINPIMGNGIYYWQNNVGISSSPHNTYINFYIENGLLGLSILLVFILGIYHMTLKMYMHSKNRETLYLLLYFIVFTLTLLFETRRFGGMRAIDFIILLPISVILSIIKFHERGTYDKIFYNNTSL